MSRSENSKYWPDCYSNYLYTNEAEHLQLGYTQIVKMNICTPMVVGIGDLALPTSEQLGHVSLSIGLGPRATPNNSTTTARDFNSLFFVCVASLVQRAGRLLNVWAARFYVEKGVVNQVRNITV